jgi:hypothetical protein
MCDGQCGAEVLVDVNDGRRGEWIKLFTEDEGA